MEPITMEQINQWEQTYRQNEKQTLMRHALYYHPLDTCVNVQENMTKNQNHFKPF